MSATTPTALYKFYRTFPASSILHNSFSYRSNVPQLTPALKLKPLYEYQYHQPHNMPYDRWGNRTYSLYDSDDDYPLTSRTTRVIYNDRSGGRHRRHSFNSNSDSDNGDKKYGQYEMPCRFKHPLETAQLKNMEEEELVELFNNISKCIEKKCVRENKPAQMNESQYRIEKRLMDKYGHDRMLKKRDTDKDEDEKKRRRSPSPKKIEERKERRGGDRDRSRRDDRGDERKEKSRDDRKDRERRDGSRRDKDRSSRDHSRR
jgi:hypothetical protein